MDRFRLWCRCAALVGLALVVARLAADETPAIRLYESSAAWGLAFEHHHGGRGDFYMVETMGSGVMVWDYDDDGDRDLFWVDSGALPGDTIDGAGSRLLRNEGLNTDGALRFRDVTAMAGITVKGYGMGAISGDVDGDGDLDLFVTTFGGDQLFLNQGDGTFVERRDATRGDPSGWSSSAAFGDTDRDGDLDLYVVRYVDFHYDKNPICGIKERQIRSYCHPDVYAGVEDRFFLGDGRGGFEDASVQAGVARAENGHPRLGKGLGVVIADLDGDHWPDVYVANDMTANFQFQNRGDGRFEEQALLNGTAVSDLGKPEAGMGIAIGDFDGNQHTDLVVTHLDLETHAVYGNMGEGMFVDRRFVSKLGEQSLYRVGFGAAFADFDHDADLDLIVANGHIIHNVELWGTGTTYKQANQVFENVDGRFQAVAGAGLDVVRSSRGLAVGDLDGDGDLDLAINNSNDRAEVYDNRSGSGHWLQVDLRDRRASNSMAIGATVVVTAGDVEQRREAHAGSSYQSQNDLTLHVGLGTVDTVDAVRVRWPDGRAMVVRGVAADQRLRIVRR